jgi:hypothetical protein
MKGLKATWAAVIFFGSHPVWAAEVSICNQSRFFLEVVDGDALVADAATGECFTMQIREKERWLINFGMTRYLFDFKPLKNCQQNDKANLVATDEGKLYCESPDQKQPRGFPLPVLRKIDLI